MSEGGHLRTELGEHMLREWLRWLAHNPQGCFLCERILFDAQMNGGRVARLEIRGAELTREEVISHLSRCVPERQRGSKS